MSANIYSHSAKIAVVGTGFVGSSFVYSLIIHGAEQPYKDLLKVAPITSNNYNGERSQARATRLTQSSGYLEECTPLLSTLFIFTMFL